MTIITVKGATILMRSGAYFDFDRPEASPFTIDDIAQGLSNICRFAGQCDPFYSVAEHSFWCSFLVPPEHAWAALMHDAAEAFIGDMVKPLKEIMPAYRAIEKRVETAIFARFNVPDPLPRAVREADITMLATEQLYLMRNKDDWDWTRGYEPADIKLECWKPDRAKEAFLRRFDELSGPTS